MIICKVQLSEDAARESHGILKYRTRIMQQEAADGSSEENCSADVERLQDDNEALQVKVIALTAQLDVCLIGTKQGIQKSFGLSAQNIECTEMLKMELVNAKTMGCRAHGRVRRVRKKQTGIREPKGHLEKTDLELLGTCESE